MNIYINPQSKKKQAWNIRVDGRLFETSETKERRDEIVEILKATYPNSTIEVQKTYVKVR